MRRATYWPPLCESDPTPGTPDEVERAGRHYASMAEEIDAQVRRLADIVDGTLAGGYVQTLTTAADGLKESLGATSGRYREVGGTLQQWAPQLRDFQDEAERLRQHAVTAGGDMLDNMVIPQLSRVDAPPPDAAVAAAKAQQGRYDDARGDLSRAQARLADLTERRDGAAARIADVIREKCDDDVANSGWDDFKDWMDEHAELVDGFCKVLGVIAMAACVVALVVPGLNIVAAAGLIGMTASGLSLAGHSALAVTGNGSWVDVGLDAFALATFGAGRFLGPGVKVLGTRFGGALGRLTAETKVAGAMARGNTARMPVQAQVNAAGARAQERLVGGVSNGVRRSVRREVVTIRAQGTASSQRAFDTAETAYLGRTAPTTALERLRFGGGDRDIAALRVQIRDSARGFSPTSQVGQAAARTDATYTAAVSATATSTVTSLWGVGTDLFPLEPYDKWKDSLKRGIDP